MTSHVADNIRRSLLPWTAADANPIRVIGLGTEILELGLTDDQPYALVQMFAHGLVIQCHPDRVEPRCSCSEAALLGVIGAAKHAAELAVEHVAMDWTYFAGVRSSTAIDVGKERAFTPKPSRTI